MSSQFCFGIGATLQDGSRSPDGSLSKISSHAFPRGRALARRPGFGQASLCNTFQSILEVFSKWELARLRGRNPCERPDAAVGTRRWEPVRGHCCRGHCRCGHRRIPLSAFLMHPPLQCVPTTTTRRKCRHENPCRRRIGEGQAARDRGGRPGGAESRRGAGRGEGHRHLPHRRVHALRRRPRRAVPGHPGPRGCRHRRRCRAGRDQREEGRPRHSALHARMPAMPVVPVAQDQSVHRHSRDPGPGRHAGRHLALLARRQEAAPLHGHFDVCEFHGAARDRGRQDSRGRSVRQGLLHRLRRHHRHRRRPQHRESGARRQVRGVRAGRHRPQCHPGAAARGRRHDHRRRSSTTPRRNGASASA